MKRIIITIFLVLSPFLILSSCTTYEGAAYIKNDLNNMTCSSNSAQTNIDIKTAKADCIKGIVDEEYFKGGASYVTVDSIKSVDRYRYADCMRDKGFICGWGASEPGKK
jgi:hypothetical protein